MSEVFLGGFVPTSVSGCQLWLDGADQTSASMTLSGSTVTVWRDKSGNANNASASGTPTQLASGVNFSGTQFFSIPGLAGAAVNTSFTFFIVEKLITSTSANQRFFGDVGYSTNAGLHTGYEIGTNYNQVKFGFYNDDLVVSSTFSGLNTQRVWTFRYQKGPGTKTVNLFGSVVGSNASNQLTSFSSPVLGQSLGGAYYQGIIYEALFFKGDITDLNMQKVEGFLAWKWGLNSSLPSSHPYFSVIPTSATGFPAALQSLATPALTPLNISGCILWMDAQDPSATGVQPSNGTSLTSWKDKSPSGFTLTSSGSAYNTTALNGLPGINIGTNFFGYDPGSGQNNWQEVFAVGIWTGGSTFTGVVNGFITSSIDSDGAVSGGGIIIEGAGSGQTTFGGGPGQFTTTPWINGVQTWTALPTAQSTFVVRTAVATSVNLRGIRFGVDRSNGRPWVGFIGECICYNTALTLTQRQQIEGYLANKWGIKSSFPSTHPYYSIPPTTTNTLRIGQAPLIPGQITTGTARTFTYTGANQSYTVPGNMTSLLIHMWGAGGGGGSLSRGGAGAYLTGILNVFPGELLTIIVGQGGRGISQSAANSGTTSAYGGGGAVLTNGNGNSYGNGGGGGRSAIQRASADIVTVGAGGGTGCSSGPGYTTYFGGAGSYNGNGSDGGGYNTTQSGKGGTLTAGGAAGPNQPSYNNNATPGSKNQGGSGDAWSGGGGSGYYGGGGASDNGGFGNGGGGGGSSYIDNLTSVGGANSTDGYSAPGTSVSFYQAGVAVGAYVGTASTATNGGNGLVVVIPVSAAVPPALQNILAPAVTPLTASGCRIWFDAADPAGTGVLPANGASISTWVDKSGTGNNATALTTSSRVPATYVLASKSIFFDRASVYTTVYPANPTQETIFVVLNITVAHATDGRLVSANYGGREIGFNTNGGTGVTAYIVNAGIAGVVTANSTGTLASNTLVTAQILGPGTTSSISINGNTAVTANGPTYSSSVPTSLGGESQNPEFRGNVMEIIIYNTYLSQLSRQQIEGYLAWKWGINASLPASHPYANASPTIPITLSMTQPYPPALTRIFSYTGADQSYIVPSGYSSVTVYMWGAGGGGGYTGTGSLYGGAGAYLQGVLTVTPGATLTIIVGGGGVYRENIGGNTTSSYGGGGTAGAASGSGGGRSAIRVSGASDDLVTVGSGGGASYINTDNCYGGNGDSVTGTGGDSGISGIYYGGKGGTQSAGGIVGSGNSGSGGTAGSKYTGGNANVSAQSGGGGGSGYYGGGGGGYYTPGSGGGGGSSFTGNLTSIVAINSPDRSTAPNTSSSYYQTGVASGGATGLGGGNGLVVIVPNAPSIPFQAITTGGLITTTAGGYRFHTFTTTGTSTFTTNKIITAQVLIVAGGGSGSGDRAAGGGAGGLIFTTMVLSSSTYSVVVGAGGTVGGGNVHGTNGSNSSFNAQVAIGGGSGGSHYDGAYIGNTGGSGGGGAAPNPSIPTAAGGAGTAGQGFGGGTGYYNTGTQIVSAGGGGGAGGLGSNATTAGGGNGGPGLLITIGGVSAHYAGGGGGAGAQDSGATVGGRGGVGGGGTAGQSSSINATPGTPNTGGGGAGAGNGGFSANASNGGSGIVIIAFIP